MIDIGDTAPNFTGPTDDGRILELKAQRGKTVVLYFYPKDSIFGNRFFSI